MCVIFATCCIFSDFYMLNIYCGICVGFLCVCGGGHASEMTHVTLLG